MQKLCFFRPNDLNESMEEKIAASDAKCLSEVTNSKTGAEGANSDTTANTTATKKPKTKEESDETKLVKNGIYKGIYFILKA